jgi:hypothetical protein
MPLLLELLNDEQHVRSSQYHFEIRLCGENNCDLCKRFGRSVKVPAEAPELREKVLEFHCLPIQDPLDKDKFLPYDEARDTIKRKKMTLKEQLDSLPDRNGDNLCSNEIAKLEENDKKNSKCFKDNKVKLVVTCNECGAPMCIFSDKAIGAPGGPSNDNLLQLQQQIETGYQCGDKITANLFVAREATQCHSPVDPQYYWRNKKQNRPNGVKTLFHRCALCYDDKAENMVKESEVLERYDSKGNKNVLPICSNCFESGLKPSFTNGGRLNQQKKKAVEKQAKEIRRKNNVKRGRKKQRVSDAIAD